MALKKKAAKNKPVARKPARKAAKAKKAIAKKPIAKKKMTRKALVKTSARKVSPKKKVSKIVTFKGAPLNRKTSRATFPLDKAGLLQAYRTMRTIREFEERLHNEFAKGDIPGFVHLYAGEEAAGTGIMMHLRDEDRIASTHRGHGHCIAKGVDVKSMMAEIYGKAAGACGGKGGSMHIADLSKGMMGANGILGAGAPLACGAALAAKYRGDGGVGISFVGDGASNQGMFLESLNLAAVWNLPAIFVIENNGYAESTSRDYAVAVDSYVDRAAGFGLPGVTIDGTDFFAVYEAAGEIIRRAREGGGPALLECKMVRFFGHFEGDQQTYRGKGEIEDIRSRKDCIKLFSSRVIEAGIITQAELDAIDAEAKREIEEAVAFAKSTPAPSLADLTTDVYVSY
jgi:pyruvate dehydrogenase E1 component alpha subunit